MRRPRRVREHSGNDRPQRRVGQALDWTVVGGQVWGEQDGWRSSTAHLQATYPARATAPLGTTGIYVGRELSGGSAFVHDQWSAFNAGVAMGTNMLILGDLRQGKSGLIKRRAVRQRLRRNRRTEIVDVKGEYGPLMDAVGGETISLYRGGPTRLNPLRPSADGEPADQLMRGVAGAALGRDLEPRERAGLDAAIGLVTRAQEGTGREPVMHELVELLCNPSSGLVDEVHGHDASEVRAELRDVGLALQQLCSGPLSGMFDGPTTADLDPNAQAACLDLHQVADDTALGVLMVCWMAFTRRAHEERKRALEHPPKTESANDEAWRSAAVRGVAQAWRAEYKLSGQTGISNVAAFHKLGDVAAGVDDGSAEQKLLEGLLEDVGTIVLFKHEHPSAADDTATRLGLSDTVRETLRSLRVDQAIWKVGPRLYHVHHETTRFERTLTYTHRATDEEAAATVRPMPTGDGRAPRAT